MDLKTMALSGVKAGPEDDLKEGEAWAYASTWTKTPDSYGDVVKQGAFKETIKAWKDSGNELPILFGHRMDDPEYFIGGAKELLEDDHGLLVKIEFDLENPKAKQVYRLVKGRRINQLSFAYDVMEDGIIDLGDDVKARELRKLKLWEVSVVPVGANQDTEVLAVKAIAEGIKAGRVLSSKNLDSLIAARDSLSAVIESASKEQEETDEASQADDADKGQEATSAKSSSRSAQAVALALSVTAY